ncbi:MAG: SDR family NAD(P)-dependent oxidoreductase [Vitreimonas sp.]
MQMSQNTILITGGTSGIGYALAVELLKRQNTILITGRSEERLAAARQSLPGVHAFICDQSDPAAIARLYSETTAAFPALNVLINNAGIGRKLNLNDTSGALEDLEREIKANFTGPVQLVKQFLPQLKRQSASLIVNVTSGLAFVPLPLKPIYCATKAAMHSYTQSLRVQLKRTAVKVVELAPPAVKTEFNKGQEELNTAAAMDVTKFAKAAVRGLEQGRDEVTPGMTPIIHLIARINPKATLRAADAEKMAEA